MIRGDAALAIRRPGQGYLRRFAGHEVRDFDRVSHRVDVRVARLQVFIDLDSATRADFQARIDRQLVFRTHPDSQDDQLGREANPRLQARPSGRPAPVRTPRRIDRAAARRPWLPSVPRGASSSPDRTAAAPGPAARPPSTATPRRTKFSTSSSPMNPAPTTTARLTPWSTRSLMRSTSCRLRSVKMPGSRFRGSAAEVGPPPGRG